MASAFVMPEMPPQLQAVTNHPFRWAQERPLTTAEYKAVCKGAHGKEVR